MKYKNIDNVTVNAFIPLFEGETESFFTYIFEEAFNCHDESEAFEVFANEFFENSDWNICGACSYGNISLTFNTGDLDNICTSIQRLERSITALSDAFITKYQLRDAYRLYVERDKFADRTDAAMFWRYDAIFQYLAVRQFRNVPAFRELMNMKR